MQLGIIFPFKCFGRLYFGVANRFVVALCEPGAYVRVEDDLP